MIFQGFNFLMTMIPLTYWLILNDPSLKFRNISRITLGMIILSSFLSGARAAYIFIPLMLFTTGFLQKAWRVLLHWTLILIALLFISFQLHSILSTFTSIKTAPSLSHTLKPMSQSEPILSPSKPILPPSKPILPPSKPIQAPQVREFDIPKWVEMMNHLLVLYPKTIVFKGIFLALEKAPWGWGTGMATLASRYGVDYYWMPFENYYAKAIFELGIPGGILIFCLFGACLYAGFHIRKTMPNGRLKQWVNAILSIQLVFYLYSFKGWPLDLEPINFLYWLFIGFMLKVPSLPLSDSSPIILKNTENTPGALRYEGLI